MDTAKGRLYARRWDPAGGAPIVLFHDSLGCVALWRDFPEQLASETGRSVVAYDRLGFGLSDPNPATLVRGSSKRKRTVISPACATRWTSVPLSRSATAWAAAWPSMSPRAMPRIAAR